MALSLGTSQTANQSTTTTAVDVVAVLNAETLEQVFEEARPTIATVHEIGELMEQPLENGSVTADHLVIRPVEISLPLVIMGETAKEVYAEIRQLYLSGTLLTVQTRSGSYASMVILEMPHDETAEAMDGISISLRLREANFVKAVYGGLAPKQVKSKPKASTAKRGAQQTTVASAPKTAKAGDEMKGSTLYRMAHR